MEGHETDRQTDGTGRPEVEHERAVSPVGRPADRRLYTALNAGSNDL